MKGFFTTIDKVNFDLIIGIGSCEVTIDKIYFGHKRQNIGKFVKEHLIETFFF